MTTKTPFLTIFTPIYNRKRFVNRLFSSILNQTCQDFEWIIIDDGSTDNVSTILKSKIKQTHSNINIRFYRVKNGGKHRAINKAVNLANGKFFFILDSDDYLIANAVKLVKSWCSEIEHTKNPDKYAGVSGLIETPEGKIIGQSGNQNSFTDATNLERRKYHLLGDKAEVYKTKILKKFPFKEFPNENFLSENTVWDRIAYAGYTIRWYPTPIYIAQYLDDGLTKNILKNNIHNFNGLIYTTQTIMRYRGFKESIGAIGYLAYVGKIKGLSYKKISTKSKISMFKLFLCKYIYFIYEKIL